MTRVLFLPPAPFRTARPKRMRPLPHHLGRLLVVLSAVAFLACDNEPLVPDDDRVIGYIDFSDIRGYEPQIPETATATVPLEMAVWTMGSGCHTGGDTEVAIEGRTAVVTPYDSLDFGAGGCTEQLKRFEHKATVVFSDPGIAEIVLRYSTTPSHKGVRRKVYTVEVSPAG